METGEQVEVFAIVFVVEESQVVGLDCLLDGFCLFVCFNNDTTFGSFLVRSGFWKGGTCMLVLFNRERNGQYVACSSNSFEQERYLVYWTSGLALSAASLLLYLITDFSATFHAGILFCFLFPCQEHKRLELPAHINNKSQ